VTPFTLRMTAWMGGRMRTDILLVRSRQAVRQGIWKPCRHRIHPDRIPAIWREHDLRQERGL